jgi:tetratricopeptide (TPR) repeat protein
MMKRLIPIFLILIGLSLLYPLQRWIDKTAPREVISEESLYFSSGEQLKKMSLGLDAMVADIYWIRTVQYFGNKVLESGQSAAKNNTGKIKMQLLAPFLDIIVNLDPHHISAYRFGAIFLPERDLPAAINLLERGIRENPNEWRLYQDLGYIYWQAGDYTKAAEAYERGSEIPGVPYWMHDMAGFMRIKGGSRETARTIYEQYAESEDPKIRAQAIGRLKQLRALNELDVINALLAEHKKATGRCAESLRPFAAKLNAARLSLNREGLPVDPDGVAYVLDAAACKADIALESPIPRQ